jgi:hypothetical protein
VPLLALIQTQANTEKASPPRKDRRTKGLLSAPTWRIEQALSLIPRSLSLSLLILYQFLPLALAAFSRVSFGHGSCFFGRAGSHNFKLKHLSSLDEKGTHSKPRVFKALHF